MMEITEDQELESAEYLAQMEEQRIVKLEALGSMLSAKRKEAIDGKVNLGIEDDMQGDEEHYQGYDDANRAEFEKSSSSSRNIDGKTRHENSGSKPAGSTVFPNITQPYVDAASARVGDVLLPTDDRNYAIEPTPIPEMAGVMPQMGSDETQSLERERLVAEAERKAKLAEDQIEDWLQETNYNTEMRKVIDDVVRLGSGVMKGPVPAMRRCSMITQAEDGSIEMYFKTDLKPESYRVDPWNFFPDPACGESIHNGSYTFERDYITSKKLESFKEMTKEDGTPFYIPSQIDKCLKEGPGKSKENNGRMDRVQAGTKNQFEIWYVYINIKADEMAACGCEVDEGGEESFNAVITMVNDNVIRAALNHFDTGEFPYDLIPWKRRPCMPWGMSLSRQLRTPQRIIVAATRRLMDNLGLAAGPQLVVSRGVTPFDGKWEIKPLKIWVQDDDAVNSATSPVQSVVIPTMQAELMATIQLATKMAEEVTGMPMLMQGQQGTAPDTVGGMTILNNNANSILRRIARLFDGSGTVPHITRYYHYLMNYGKDDDMKGDFKVVARGSTALVERDIQSQEMVGVLQLCLNPAYKKNPEKAMNEYLKSRRFDAGAFDYTEAELKAIQGQTPPAPPQVQAAQIRAETELKKVEITNKTREQEILVSGQIAKMHSDASVNQKNAELEHNAQREEIEHNLKIAELQLKQKNAEADYANKRGISLDKAKTVLATTGMKLNVQKELSGGNGGEVLTPPIEPPQRAPDGQSFQQ